jgi:hypothetical protein
MGAGPGLCGLPRTPACLLVASVNKPLFGALASSGGNIPCLEGVEQGGVDMSSDMVRWGGLAGVAAGVMLSRPDPRRAGRGAGSLLVGPEGPQLPDDGRRTPRPSIEHLCFRRSAEKEGNAQNPRDLSERGKHASKFIGNSSACVFVSGKEAETYEAER